MHLLILLLSNLLMASPNSTDMYEGSFPRDNTFCQVGENKVEFSLRGHTKFTEPKDRGYGELLFYRLGEKRVLIPDVEGRSGYYRFFKSENGLCSKAASYDLDGSTFALLLLKANRPHKDKLTIQLLDSKKLSPLKTYPTEFLADKTMLAPGGFTFRTNSERIEIEMGSVMMGDKKFTYQDRDFQEWVNFDKKGFWINEKLTFQQSPYKNFFKDEADFFQVTAWSPTEKKFQNRTFYLAVNHQERRECLLVLKAPIKLTGSEEWRCKDK